MILVKKRRVKIDKIDSLEYNLYARGGQNALVRFNCNRKTLAMAPCNILRTLKLLTNILT